MAPERTLMPLETTRREFLLAAAAAAMMAGCAKKKTVRIPAPPAPGYVETGMASWYGPPYHGRRAASGEIYDMEKLTAAHRTLPFGTWLEVRNLTNDRTVRVRIIDRGPFAEGRIIDLSKAAAREIGMLGPGTAKVRLEVVSPSQPPGQGVFAVQIGAFQDRGNAERLQRKMKERFGECRLTLRDGQPPLWRVLVGREPGLPEANALAERLRAEWGSAFVVRLDEPASDSI